MLKSMDFTKCAVTKLGDLATVLENRSGLQSLKWTLFGAKLDARIVKAINHHGSTLTCLDLSYIESIFPHVMDIVGSCGHLRDFTTRTGDKSIEPLMNRDVWKNPDMLESLNLCFSVQEQCMLPTTTPIEGWTSSFEPEDNQGTLPLTLLQAALGYSRLRTVVLCGVVYKRVDPQ